MKHRKKDLLLLCTDRPSAVHYFTPERSNYLLIEMDCPIRIESLFQIITTTAHERVAVCHLHSLLDISEQEREIEQYRMDQPMQ